MAHEHYELYELYELHELYQTCDLHTGHVSARAGAERAAQSSRSEFRVYTRAQW